MILIEKILNPKWENVTVTLKNVTDEMGEKITKAKQDLKLIDAMKSSFGSQMKDKYLQTLDMSQALAENTRLEEQDKLLKKSQVQTAEPAQSPVPEPIAPQNVSPAPASPILPPVQASGLHIIDIRLQITDNQFNDLVVYLKTQGINFGKVPKEAN